MFMEALRQEKETVALMLILLTPLPGYTAVLMI